MKREDISQNFIEKLNHLRKLLMSRFPAFNMQNLTKSMCQIAHYHYNKKSTFLLGEEKAIYTFLVENSYNPFTVYRWLLLERVPEDIRFQLRERRISQKKACKMAFTRRHETSSSLGGEIITEGLNLIRRM